MTKSDAHQINERQEIELKLAVADHAAVRAAVEAEGGRYVGSFEQTDQFYDSADGRLRRAGSGLRIRQIRQVDGEAADVDARPEVTFKGPRRMDAKAKVRPEYQTRLDDAKALATIFGACGLEPFAVVRKTRTSFLLDPCMVELDELEGVGPFVEIEGPSEEAVFHVSRRLGLGGEPIHESYLAMVLKRQTECRS